MRSPRRRILAGCAAVLIAALGLSSCTGNGDDGSSPSSDASSDSSEQEDGSPTAGSDQSDAVFGAYTAPKPLGSAKSSKAGGFNINSTLEVLELRDTPEGTVLTYQLTGEKKGTTNIDARSWGQQPHLVDTKGEKAYLPVTVEQGAFESEEAQNLCLCTGIGLFDKQPTPQQVLYESLPDDLDTIDVRMERYEPTITVDVSR